MTGTTIDHAEAIEVARQHVYRFLALATSDPRSARWRRLLDAETQETALAAAALLAADPTCRPGALAPGEAPPDELNLAAMVAALRAGPAELNDEYERIFGLMLAKKCPPYETEYCPQTFSVYRSHTLADVAGFYRAFGLGPSDDTPERADHVSLELEFVAFLIARGRSAPDADRRAICHDAQRRFVREHLCWWVPAFARALHRHSQRVLGGNGSGFYPALSRALAAFVAVERAALAVDPPTELVQPGPVDPPEEMSCQECAFASAGVIR
jgi:TorA maturation chaperone TorD